MRAVQCLVGFGIALTLGSAAGQDLRAGTGDTKPAATPPAEAPVLTPESRGDLFMVRKMYREAVDMYKSITGQSHIILNKIGIAFHQLGDMGQAKKYYERSTKRNPKYAEAINNLGTIHYAGKNYRRAISSYKNALLLSPNSASIHSNLGTAYFARKNYAEAAKEYSLALSLDPEVFEHRSTQGVLLQERTVEERAKFYFYLAKTYARAGVQERAFSYMRKALEEGFKERKKFLEDEDFAALRGLPEFELIMKLEPRVL